MRAHYCNGGTAAQLQCGIQRQFHLPTRPSRRQAVSASSSHCEQQRQQQGLVGMHQGASSTFCSPCASSHWHIRPAMPCGAVASWTGRLVPHTSRRPLTMPTLSLFGSGSITTITTPTAAPTPSVPPGSPTASSATGGAGGGNASGPEGRLSTAPTSLPLPASPASPVLPAMRVAAAQGHKGHEVSVAASATAPVAASLWSFDGEDAAEEEVEQQQQGVAHNGNQVRVTAAGGASALLAGAAKAAAARAQDAMQQRIDAWAASATIKQQPLQQQQAAAGAVEEGLGWRRRWTMVLLCFFAFILCNMDRVNMAVAILPMSQQYGWQPATQGLIQSAFFWGYLCTQILGGVWAAKFGGKLVLGLGVAWWSIATALTPFAAQAGLPVLMAARALMGLGEGVAMPAMNQLLSKWVPNTERSRSLSLVYSGMFLGSMVGLTISPRVINAFGWPSVFVWFGSLGLVWLAAWTSQAAASPAQDSRCSPAERAFIAAHGTGTPLDLHHAGSTHSTHGGGSMHVEPAAAVSADRPVNVDGAAVAVAEGEDDVQEIPWRLLLSRKEVWAIILSHFCHNWGTFILLTWMPSYYNQVLGLDLASSGTLSCLPWATMAVSANVGGWLADMAISRGATITTVRKVMQTVGFLGPAFFLGQLSNVDTAVGAVVCMMGAQGCDAFSQSGLYSNHQDIAPRYAGVLLGLSNTAGVLAGVLGSLVTGFILQHGTWDQVWQVAIALYLVGTCIWNAWATGEKVID